MRIVVNGADREVVDGLTVVGLLDDLEIDRRYVAVERNREIVPRARHADTLLEEGDRLEVVTMVGGG